MFAEMRDGMDTVLNFSVMAAIVSFAISFAAGLVYIFIQGQAKASQGEQITCVVVVVGIKEIGKLVEMEKAG